MESKRKYEGALQWRENETWYGFDEDTRNFFLTEKAPEEARRSFEKYSKIIANKKAIHELEKQWMRKDEWYTIDEERGEFVLTNKAPEEARISFEKWKKINKLKW